MRFLNPLPELSVSVMLAFVILLNSGSVQVFAHPEDVTSGYMDWLKTYTEDPTLPVVGPIVARLDSNSNTLLPFGTDYWMNITNTSIHRFSSRLTHNTVEIDYERFNMKFYSYHGGNFTFFEGDYVLDGIFDYKPISGSGRFILYGDVQHEATISNFKITETGHIDISDAEYDFEFLPHVTVTTAWWVTGLEEFHSMDFIFRSFFVSEIQRGYIRATDEFPFKALFRSYLEDYFKNHVVPF